MRPPGPVASRYVPRGMGFEYSALRFWKINLPGAGAGWKPSGWGNPLRFESSVFRAWKLNLPGAGTASKAAGWATAEVRVLRLPHREGEAARAASGLKPDGRGNPLGCEASAFRPACARPAPRTANWSTDKVQRVLQDQLHRAQARGGITQPGKSGILIRCWSKVQILLPPRTASSAGTSGVLGRHAGFESCSWQELGAVAKPGKGTRLISGRLQGSNPCRPTAR